MHGDFDALAARALAAIPERFRARLRNVAICIEGRCAEDPELLGVYDGVAATDRTIDEVAPLPDRIVLYEETIREEAAETDGDLYRVIRETLIHEIAHHFGYDEMGVQEKFESRFGEGS